MAGRVLLSALLLLIAGRFSLGQDCPELDVGSDSNPFSGSNLPVCATTSPQCCTVDYVRGLQSSVPTRMVEGVRTEMNSNVVPLQTAAMLVNYYFGNTFFDAFVANLPQGVNSYVEDNTEQFEDLVQQLTNNFEIRADSTFTGRGYMAEFVERVLQLVAVGLSNDTTTQACVRRVSNSHINQTAVNVIGDSIDQLRRSITSLTRTVEFVVEFQAQAGGFEPLEACIRRTIQLSFCGRCTQRTRPLCRNICGALIRGCYSPFYGLRRQFDSLWDVTGQVVDSANDTLRTIFTAEQRLVDNLINLALDLDDECGTTFDISSILGKRDTDNSDNYLPVTITAELERLSGVVQYDNQGPSFCTRFAALASSSCNRMEVCTAINNCWNGTAQVASDINRYGNNDIMGQDDNPAFTFDEEMLTQQLDMLGTPVNDFFASESFSSVIPEGVEVPMEEGGAGAVVVSLSLFLAASLLAVISSVL